MRDVEQLNAIVEEIATAHGRLDGLIAAAGIQQETPALEYTAKDSDMMMSVNVTGCFMTAQAAAKQMVRFGNGGSIVMIASMSGTIANRVCVFSWPLSHSSSNDRRKLTKEGTYLPRLQRLKSSRHPTRSQPRRGMGRIRHQGEHHFSRLYRDGDGGGAV